MSFQWKDDFLPWLPPVLTLIGWFLVNLQNNKRELRKDARSAVDNCKKLAIEAVFTAGDYWLGKNEASAWAVKAKLEALETEIRRFPNGKGREKLQQRCVDLVDAVTSGDFDSRKMKPKESSSDSLFRQIAHRRQLFLQEAEQQFEQHFP